MRLIQKSKKLADVCYDIRGPVLEKARQMEEEGHKIIKLNIGNLAVFGFDAPDEKPVNLLIFLLVPEASTQKHLEILSEIAELLSDTSLREKIKTCDDAGELHRIISTWNSVQP